MDCLRPFMPRRFTLVALAFELSLGGLGLVLGWWFGRWPALLTATGAGPLFWRDMGLGLLATLPLLAGLIVIQRHPAGILRQLQRTVQEEVVPLFHGTSAAGLFAISAAAGVGEELLFRGFLQSAVADGWGPLGGAWIGLVVASFVFGICHSLCAAYAVVATAIGLVLGVLYLATGSLVAPITTHVAYDFLALLYLLRGTNGRSRAAHEKRRLGCGQHEPP